MSAHAAVYCIWIDWKSAVASFHPVNGYEALRFDSRENYHARLHILVQSGFRFQ